MTFAGTWDCAIATPIGLQNVKLHIREEAGRVMGEAEGAETVPFLDAAIIGDHLRWTQKTTKPMTLTIKFDVTHDGDELVGTAKAGIFPTVKVTGKRVSTQPPR